MKIKIDAKDDVKDLNEVKADESDCEERLTEAPQKAGFMKHRNSSHEGESTCNQSLSIIVVIAEVFLVS